MAEFFDVEKNFLPEDGIPERETIIREETEEGVVTSTITEPAEDNTHELKTYEDVEAVNQALDLLLQSYEDDVVMDTSESPFATWAYEQYNDEEDIIELEGQVKAFVEENLPVSINTINIELIIPKEGENPDVKSKSKRTQVHVAFDWELILDTTIAGTFGAFITVD